MVLRGHHVFAANKSGFVDVFDVSNPADPVFVDAIDTVKNGGVRSPHDIGLVDEDHIIIVNAGDSGSFEEESSFRPGGSFLRAGTIATTMGTISFTAMAMFTSRRRMTMPLGF